MPAIEFKNVSFSYKRSRKNDQTDVFKNLSVIFPDNSFNVIIGQSGCGKTTLLRLITGFIDDFEGDIYIDNKNTDLLSVGERKISYVNQKYVLYPHLTVFDNIAFPLKAVGASKEEIIERVTDLAKKFDLLPALHYKPKYLSGGQRQKVALARALVKKADIYLFDEPLSNLDQEKRVEQRIFIKRIIKEENATAIYVTHDFIEAMSLADYLFVMDNGNIVINGKPQEVYNSGNEIVTDFIKATFMDKDYEK